MNVHLVAFFTQNFGTVSLTETNFNTGRILIKGIVEEWEENNSLIVEGNDVGWKSVGN